MFLRADRRGDTIVEVMIVLAVIGLGVSISYATANRSLLDTRQAEENAQATRYVQAQIETLYSLADSQNALEQSDPNFISTIGFDDSKGSSLNDIYAAASNHAFCMPPDPSNGTNLVFYDPTSSTDPHTADCATSFYQVAVYDCDNYTTGAPCQGNTISGSDTFVTQVVWPDVSGDGSDSVTQAYRIHPGEHL